MICYSAIRQGIQCDIPGLGYILPSELYIPQGAAEGNIYPKPGMSHYIPCLIAE